MNTTYQLKLTSGMTKARLHDSFTAFPPLKEATALKGDRYYFSALISATVKHGGVGAHVGVEGTLAPYITTYIVEQVPVKLPHYRDKGDLDYLDHNPGLFPDLLTKRNHLYVMDYVHQVYFEVKIPADFTAGDYPITVVLTDDEENEIGRESLTLSVLDAVLPALDIQCTLWFHYDCLADYYGVKVFSERHWEIIENYLSAYAESGYNTILTPIFTPALDTKVGGERPTVQLVGITLENGTYTFDFSLLERFLALTKKLGITHLEIAHFFTQWGAAHAPKVMATIDGAYKRLFGWETDATSEEYVTFLRTLIPALCRKLDACGYKGHYFFHISDEPKPTNLECYKAAKAGIADLLAGYPVRDALSHYEFYEQGVVEKPIVGTDHAAPFVEHEVPDLWVYYCCSQGKDVSHRFYAMPGYRTRVLGAQMYKANVTGFLEWGYNFYYSRLSQYLVNPFLINDCDYAFPAGDAYVVYPAPDGTPIPSLHGILFEQALLDLRALKLAEAKVGREKVLAAVLAAGDITFTKYPRNEEYLLNLRDTVNRLAAGN